EPHLAPPERLVPLPAPDGGRDPRGGSRPRRHHGHGALPVPASLGDRQRRRAPGGPDVRPHHGAVVPPARGSPAPVSGRAAPLLSTAAPRRRDPRSPRRPRPPGRSRAAPWASSGSPRPSRRAGPLRRPRERAPGPVRLTSACP